MRIDIPISREQITPTSRDRLSSLKEGDKIRAKVLEIKGDLVRLELTSGQVVYGKSELPFDLSDEKFFKFVIKGMDGNTLTLAPDYEGMDLGDNYFIKDENVATSKVLKQLGLERTEENLSIIKHMVKFNMPLDDRMAFESAKYVDKIKSLLNLESGEAIYTFDNIEDYSKQDISKLFKAVPKELFGITGDTTAMTGDMDMVSGQKLAPETLKGLSELMENKSIFKNMESLISLAERDGILSTSERANLMIQAQGLNVGGKELTSEIMQRYEDNLNQLLEKISEKLSSSSHRSEGLLMKLSQLNTSIEEYNQILKSSTSTSLEATEKNMAKDDFKAIDLSRLSEGGEKTSQEDMARLKNLIDKIDGDIESSVLGKGSAEAELSIDRELYKDITQLVKNDLSKLFPNERLESKDIQKLVFLLKSGIEPSIDSIRHLNDMIDGRGIASDIESVLSLSEAEGLISRAEKNEMLLQAQRLSADFKSDNIEPIKEYVNNLNRLLQNISEKLSNSSNRSELLSSQLSELNGRLDIYNKINEKAIFMFMPINVRGDDLKDKLYIMSKKRHKSSSESITAYISLETSNLNRVNVICEYKYGVLDVKFKVDEDKVTRFLDTKDAIRNALLKLDYNSVNISVKGDLQEDVLDMMASQDSINYMLDIKV